MGKDSEDMEKYFQSSLQMALRNNISWILLGSILDEMTPNLAKSKQVIRFLLEELEKMHLKLQESLAQNNVNETESMIDTTVDETLDSEETSEEYRKADREKDIQEMQDEKMSEKGDIISITNDKEIVDDETEIDEDFSDVEPRIRSDS